MTQHWTEYWRQGHTTSFGDSLSSNYEGILQSVWENTFSILQTDFIAVDVGTGNGSVPLLLRESLRASAIVGKVYGVDLAEVQLSENNKSENSTIEIELISNTACESLPFANDSVDLYMSQFGFEYSAIELSLKEASRVLRANGQFSIVFHHDNSMILNRNKKILSFIDLPQTSELIEYLSEIAIAMGPMTTAHDITRIKQDPVCESVRIKINQSIKFLVEYDELSAQDSQLMTFIAQFFKEGVFWPLAKKQQYIEFIKLQMDTLKLRLSELVNASFDEDKLANFISIFKQNFLELNEIKVLKNEQNEVLSWYLNATKK
ncbi:class I SAM-dependent methyltransferase [Shewanella sp. MF05960]|uniref:class I SAM-dependent methyltransferase n=1 Tax=Shewanella sp. MF05960 TaxID=3434874 RepID=UPI003D7B7046